MARERLAALRHAIARIEGRPAETLDGTVGRAAADAGAEFSPAASSFRGRVSSRRSLGEGGSEARNPEGRRVETEGAQAGGPESPGNSLGKPLWIPGPASPSRNDGRDLIRTGVAPFDTALGGGLQAAALTELRTDETRHAAALLGFALCLAVTTRTDMPLLWLSADAAGRETGLPYLPGICGLAGIAPGSLFTGLGRTVHDTLWVAEEAAASGAFSAVILELRGNPKALGLDETRRLQRRAVLSGKPLFLLRVAGMAEPTTAPVRLAIAPAPSVPRRTRDGPLEGSIGAPAFRVAVEKARAPSHPPFILEWNPNELLFTGRQADSLPRPAASADRPDRPPALGRELAHRRSA
jgi:protein ImuA